jgi:hypothetical protein
MGYGIWIDYNQDGDFSDAGEQIFSKSLASRSAILSSFTIPTTAKLGYTRMRVILQDGTYPRSYCGDITTGEVEDYTINIVAAGTSLANELMNREATTITNLTATPNPFTNETVISFDNKNNEQFSVSLTDVLGRTVQSFTNQTGSQITLTRNNLPSGWYILTLAMQNGERYTHKLVIE